MEIIKIKSKFQSKFLNYFNCKLFQLVESFPKHIMSSLWFRFRVNLKSYVKFCITCPLYGDLTKKQGIEWKQPLEMSVSEGL